MRRVFWKVLSHAGQTWLEERSTIGMQIQVASSVLVRQHREEEEESDTNAQIQMHKCTHTNSQKHKYTNTAYDKMTKIPNICYIFEQLVVQGCKK